MFNVGDKVIVFQDTKSYIGNNSGPATIVKLPSYPFSEVKLKVKFYNGNELLVHPDDIRPLTKLDKALK